jgi:hypothetical protein
MEVKLQNRHDSYARPTFVDPPPLGYLYVGAAVEPPKGRLPFPGCSARRKELTAHLKSLAGRLRLLPEVVRATVYRATLMPPTGGPARRAAFDVAVLVETTEPGTIEAVAGSDVFNELLGSLRAAASDVHVMRARCIRCIADVDKTRPGTYLFNHFVTETGADEAVALWEDLAGWYTAETGLENSTLLAPSGGEDEFVFVNHARWDHGLAWVMLHQLPKRTFRSYVLTNLREKRTTAMPVLYELA